jgi:pyruvate dehydrogenase (quinone)
VLDAAFAAEGPVMIEAVVDKYEPMLPPKVPAEYRKNFEKALQDTEGAEQIAEIIREEPLRTMMEAGRK